MRYFLPRLGFSLLPLSVVFIMYFGLLQPVVLFAQIQPTGLGEPPNNAMINLKASTGPFDVTVQVNASNGNLHVELPLVNYPQRGMLNVNHTLVYDTATWYSTNDTADRWIPNDSWQLLNGTGQLYRTLTSVVTTANSCPDNGGSVQASYYSYGPFSFIDDNNTAHSFSLFTADPTGCPNSSLNDLPSAQGYSDDGTGYFMSITNHTNVDIFSPDGTRVYSDTVFVPGSTSQNIAIEDTNGNYMWTTSNGSALHDTIGRVLPWFRLKGGSTALLYQGGPPLDTSPSTFDFPVAAGTAEATIYYELIPVCTDFAGGGTQFCATSSTSAELVQPTSITLPDGRAYVFTYDQGSSAGHYGALTGITLPTGGQLTFHYRESGTFLTPSPVEIDHIDVNGAAYDFSYTISPATVTPNVPFQTTTVETGPARYDSASQAMLRDDTVWVTDTVHGSLLSSTTYNGSAGGGQAQRQVTLGYLDPTTHLFPNSVTTTSGSVSATTHYSYIPPIAVPSNIGGPKSYQLNVIQQKDEWDYGVPISSTPTRSTIVTYDQSPSLVNAHIIDHPHSVKMFDHGNLLSETDYAYDGSALSSQSGFVNAPVEGAVGHDDQTYPATSAQGRGNLTSVQKIVAPGQIISELQAFNMLGERISSTDGNGYNTLYDYTDCFTSSQTSGSCTNANSFAAPTSTRNPLNQVSTSTLNYADGTLQSTRDANDTANIRDGKKSSYDVMQRLTDTYEADNGHTHIDYGGAAVPVIVTTTTSAGPDPDIVSTSTLDGYGRTITSSSNGITIDTTYDGYGRILSKSNPHLGTSSPATDGLSYSYYDSLGRKTKQVNTDASSDTWTYSSNIVTFQDEMLSQWQFTYDWSGRLTKVMEPDGSPNRAGTPTLETDYSYNALNNLISVNQTGGPSSPTGGRTRVFVYDGLGRLTNACNPEALPTGSSPCSNTGPWSMTYGYDGNSNVLTQTDANHVTTTNYYDALNRVYSKTFSGGSTATPIVTYEYDSGPANGNFVGRLVDEFTGSKSQPYALRTIQQYDPAGRTKGEIQCVLGKCASSSGSALTYGYDLAGAVSTTAISNAGPPITIAQSYDGASRLVSLSSSYSGDPANPTTFNAAYPDRLFSAGNGAYGAVGLVSPSYAVLASTGIASMTRSINYDKRLRVASDTYTSSTTEYPATPTVDVITIAPASSNGDVDQAKQVTGTPAAGRGSVIVSGAEKTYQVCQNGGTSCRTVSDSGSIVLTIGTYTATATYGAGITTPQVVQSLLSGLNASNSPVSATAQGLQNWQSGQSIQINIVSSATGDASNYSLSWTGTNNEGGCSKGCHSTPDFSLGLSGSTLSGGHGAVYTVYDNGTMSVAVNSTVAAVLWGQNDTVETIAEKLAVQVQSIVGSTVTAAPSGATVTLTSLATGPDSGFTVSLSNTFDSTDFSTSSFTPVLTSQTAGLGPHQGSGTLYGYSIVQSDGTTSGYDKDGNINNYSDSVMGQWQGAYDNLNRLRSATVSGGQYDGMTLAWNIDTFGNRLTQSPTGHIPPQNTPGLTFNNPLNHADQLAYDLAGNVSSDGSNNYLFDAESRICAIQQGGPGGTVVGYLYDAESHRVAKGSLSSFSCDMTSNGFAATNMYILGQQGEQVVQLDGAGNWKHTNVYAAGTLLAAYDPNGLHYVLSDWLGTKRVQYSPLNGVEESCSSLPYGDSLACNGPEPNTTDNHFTGKERDVESGLDYFGARQYGSSMGRFMSPDPLGIASGNLANPQSLNLYSYVLNNPLVNVDPDGKECVWDDGSYDSNDDKDTGSPEKCAGQGGTWIGHDVFSNSPYYRGDWSPSADAETRGLVQNIQSCSAAAGGGQAQSLLIANAFTMGYTNDEAAYLLASAQWESGMGSSMIEHGSVSYLSQYDGNANLGNTQKGDGPLFRGRGYIQITGRRAYTGWSKVLGVDLLDNPTLATNPDIAAQIAAEGSFRGTFTGRSLYDYINESGSDFVNARRVINGDVAKNGSTIAGIANGFATSLSGCR